MKKRRLRAFLLALLLLLAACTGAPGASVPGSGGPASSQSADGTRTSEGGQVTVVATWRGPATGATFDIKLDTHSTDLDSLDLSNAVLRNDRGDVLAAQPWAAAKGGHHREGSLTFEGDAAKFLAGASWIELTVSGVGDIPERTLRWEIGP